MNINHPLYSTLKDYYINISNNIDINLYSSELMSKKSIDNSLIMQYIEDICDIETNGEKSNIWYFKQKCSFNNTIVYFCNVVNNYDKINDCDRTDFYCNFSNKRILVIFKNDIRFYLGKDKTNKYMYVDIQNWDDERHKIINNKIYIYTDSI